MQERLAVRLWVDALLRRAGLAGAGAFVVQRGDEARGDVLVRVSLPGRRAWLYAPVMDPGGQHGFVNLAVQGVGPDEAAVEAYVQRACSRDRDLWVIEIEDPQGRHFLTEPVREPPDLQSPC
jgi:hypothetical protein